MNTTAQDNDENCTESSSFPVKTNDSAKSSPVKREQVGIEESDGNVLDECEYICITCRHNTKNTASYCIVVRYCTLKIDHLGTLLLSSYHTICGIVCSQF